MSKRKPKLDKDTIEKILEDARNCSNFTELAKLYGITRSYLYYLRKKYAAVKPTTVDDDRKLQRVTDTATSLKRKYREAVRKIDTLDEEITLYRSAQGLMNVVKPRNYKIPSPKKGQHVATPVLVCSDWHIDEVIEPGEIGGVNEFNKRVAEERVERLFSYATKLIKICKQDSEIDTLVIAALGDFMSSWIHDELIETNSMTPPEAIQALFEMWIGGLNMILETGLVKRIRFIGCVGNHGRITQRIQFKNRAKKSYEWLLYNLLAHHYAEKGETRIEFQLPNGYFNWLELYGKMIRFHHGDNIRYNGGVGGVHIPVRKAIAQWNKVRHADLDVFGHWHTEEWSRDYVINNSLIGYSTFAENLKADFNPAGQAFFLMHPKFGKTAMYNIKLQD